MESAVQIRDKKPSSPTSKDISESIVSSDGSDAAQLLVYPLCANDKSAVRMLVRAGFDLVALLFSLVTGYFIAELFRLMILSEWTPIERTDALTVALLLLSISSLLTISLLGMKGHYHRRRPFWAETRDQLHIVIYSATTMALVSFLTKYDFSRAWTVGFLISACIMLPLFRILSRLLLTKTNAWYRSAIIIDDCKEAYDNAQKVVQDKNLGLKVLTRISIDSKKEIQAILKLYDRVNDSSQDSGFAYRPPHLIVATADLGMFSKHKPLFDRLMDACPVLTFVTPIGKMPLYHSELVPLFKNDSVLLRLNNRLLWRTSAITKRSTDIILSSVLIGMLSPLMLIAALMIKMDGGSVFFHQKRLGKNGKRFSCIKFRTMVMDAEQRLATLLANDPEAALSWQQEQKLKNDPRITRIGQFLRKSSLDELPQIINVLRGEMSFVGPRPIVDEEIERYGDDFHYFCKTRPGITGLWQVSGRNDVSYEERIRLDVWYAKNWSLWLDIVIMLKTIPIVLGRDGAY